MLYETTEKLEQGPAQHTNRSNVRKGSAVWKEWQIMKRRCSYTNHAVTLHFLSKMERTTGKNAQLVGDFLDLFGNTTPASYAIYATRVELMGFNKVLFGLLYSMTMEVANMNTHTAWYFEEF